MTDDQKLRALLGPREPEVGCDECFDQLDRYVEAELAGRDVDATTLSSVGSSSVGSHLNS